MAERRDRRLGVPEANRVLVDLSLYRCAACSLVLVRPGPFHQRERHGRCGGIWREVSSPLERAILVRFLSRQMLAGPRIRR